MSRARTFDRGSSGRRAQPRRPAGFKPKTSGPRRISTGLVALSSAAIISVYAIGYARTQSAEDQIASLQNQSSALVASVPTTLAPVATPAEIDDQSAPVSTAAATVPDPTGTAPVASPTPEAASVAVALPTIAPSPTYAPRPTVSPTAAASASQYKDGTYVGLGYSRHGNIEATVVVKGGKIASAEVTQCLTRYPCSEIADLPGQVLSRQTPPVDLVSGATDSSLAYRMAVTQALAKAT